MLKQKTQPTGLDALYEREQTLIEESHRPQKELAETRAQIERTKQAIRDAAAQQRAQKIEALRPRELAAVKRIAAATQTLAAAFDDLNGITREIVSLRGESVARVPSGFERTVKSAIETWARFAPELLDMPAPPTPDEKRKADTIANARATIARHEKANQELKAQQKVTYMPTAEDVIKENEQIIERARRELAEAK